MDTKNTLTLTRSWHAEPEADVIVALETSWKGLSSVEARRRLEAYGENRLEPPRRRTVLERLFDQFNNVLIYVLLAAAITSLFLGEFVDASVIGAVVVINALIGFLQEGKAERSLDAVMKILAVTAHVARDDERIKLDAVKLVPGDVVFLKSGDRVPADMRLVQARNLSIQEAVLTGESEPTEKGTAPVPEPAVLADRDCMAYSGTLVARGRGVGVVVATGRSSEMGHISSMLKQVSTITTPMIRQLEAFGRWLTVTILVLSAATFAFGYLWRGLAPEEMFMVAVGIAVAAIPEGLPAIMTIALAIGVSRMAGRNAIIRRLPAVETLGSVMVICTDKTGTLTHNEMTVQQVISAEDELTLTGSGYQPDGLFLQRDRPVDPLNYPVAERMLRVGALCSESSLEQRDGIWTTIGDPMEGALITAAMKAGLDPSEEMRRWVRHDLIPFESESRRMASLHRGPGEELIVFVKGAPETVIEISAFEATSSGRRPIDKANWHEITEKIAQSGRRLIAIAECELKSGGSHIEPGDIDGGLTLLGLFALADPPREEVASTIRECQSAGISIKMITGDHAGTARAIAEEIGIGPNCLTGSELDTLDEDELRRHVMRTDIYARSSPRHKLQLVKALQSLGQVIVMTGDGVNDAPALKRADVGVAMGIKGTEVSKEASEVVLVNDDFSSIAHAVREGRTVHDNIKKSIAFILPTSIAEAALVVAAILAGVELPITPVQILWINLVTTVTLALALGFEKPETNIMRRPPRDPDEPIISGYLVWRIILVSIVILIGVFGMFAWSRQTGASLEEARTVAVNTVVFFEVFYLFNTRKLSESVLNLEGLFGSRICLLAVIVVFALQMLFTFAPGSSVLFEAMPLGFSTFAVLIAIASSVFWIVEIEKFVAKSVSGQLTRGAGSSNS